MMSKYQESVVTDSQNLSISCNNVPDALLDKSVAKKYFQRFGKILRIRLRPKHKMCIIEFANEESAQIAYNGSGEYHGQDFIVSWSKDKSINDKNKIPKTKLDDGNWSDDPDIKSELDAMKGNFTMNKTYNLRPEAMVTEQNQKKITSKTNKMRHKKSDKVKSKNLESMTDQETELLKTIMTCAFTSEDKFRILEARDKLIRSRTVKQSELAQVTKTIGTCPDMCPEKERLMREVRHQVAAYEQLAGSTQKSGMNHKLAVKQYSRSSADQETPLAHELRPVDVLQLTMGYLLHRIMDLCETQDVNLAEWYHFVWDRTRGIRKDVTQQELCCEKSVALVEQCARFHIHCAARLVAEDISVFDDKINTENLTKCLQTLKYMYHDLKVKHNITCRNEAEFRAYIVLLNLNDGNFMWEVQQLSPDIQQSKEVRFALNVYSALDTNNYVRFFKLIKSTSYLNACILLRYFNQVRFRALLTIIKSYSLRLPYPVDDLCGMLAFEDIFNTIAFLEYHGLQLNVEKTHVSLDRNRFHHRDTPFALDRAINIVESKRNISVGEIVCGEKLPQKSFETHVPYDSFDERGYLNISELPKDFQTKYQQFLKQFSEDTPPSIDDAMPNQSEVLEIPEEEPPKKPFTFTTNQVFPPSKVIVPIPTPKAPEFVFKLPTTTIQETSETDGEVRSIFTSNRSQSPLLTKNEPFVRSESPLMIISTNNETSKTFWDKSNNATYDRSIFGNTNNFDKPNKIILPDNQETNFKKTSVIEIVKQSTNTAAAEISRKELPTQIIEYKNNTEEILREKQHQEQLLKKKENEQRKARIFAEEKLKELRRKQQQDQLKLKQKNDRKKQAAELYEKEIKIQVQLIINEVLSEVEENVLKNRLHEISENIKMRKVLQFGRRWRNLTKISKRKRKNFFVNPVWVSSRSVSEEAEELFTSSQDLTLHDVKRYKYGSSSSIAVKERKVIETLDIYKITWKILFEQINSVNIFWKIGISIPGNDHVDEMLQLALDIDKTKNMLLKELKSNKNGSLNVCIKKIIQHENNLNGLIFFCSDKNFTQRFEKVIFDKTSKVPFPLVILIKTHSDIINIEQQLNLHQLLKKQIISNYEIFKYTENDFETILTKTLQFLALNYYNYSNKLETNELGTLLRNYLGEEFWFRIRSSAEINKRFSILLEQPNNVIELYNEALKFCTKLLFNKNNYAVPNFPTEFQDLQKNDAILLPCTYEYFPNYWNSTFYVNKLKRILESFHLPKMTSEWPPTNRDNFQEIIKKYCSLIFKENTNAIYKIFSFVYRKLNGNIDFISWIDIIELIILEKINCTQFKDDKYPIYTLVYNSDEMKDYRRAPWWFQLKSIQKGIQQIHYVEDFTDTEIIVDVSIDEDSIDLDKTLLDVYNKNETLQKTHLKKEYNELTSLMVDLERSMEIQKKIMDKFQETALMAID